MIIILFTVLVLIFSLPQVQTQLANSITNRLNKDFKTNINANQISIKYDGMVNIKDVLILDHKQDTLIHAKQIQTSLLNVETIFKNNLTFGKVTFFDVLFNIKTYKGEKDTGLDIFVDSFNKNSKSNKKTKNKFVLSAEKVIINNGVFNISNENKDNEKVLKFSKIGITAADFLIDGRNVSMDVNHLEFLDDRGIAVKELITKFEYTPKKMVFNEFKLATKNSEVYGDLEFNYKRENLKYFTEKVSISASIKKSKIVLDELNVFYDEFGKNQVVRFSTLVSGTLNNLKTKQLRLRNNRSTKIYGDIVFKNLFNKAKDNFEMDGDLSNLSSNYLALKALLPNVLGDAIPEIFRNLGDFKINGKTKITSSTVKGNFEINTPLGFIKSNLNLNKINNIDDANYSGNIILDVFDLGKFLNDKTIGKVSLNLDVNGFGFRKDNLRTTIKGSIYDLGYNNYTYKNIAAEGKLKQNVFNGKFEANDPNLKLKFNGLADLSKKENFFDFVADIRYANLKALNFYNKDKVSEFVGLVDMKVKGTSLDDAVGDVLFRNTFYKNENDIYNFKDFFVKSYFKNDSRYLKVNSPDIIEGELSGNYKLKSIPKLFKNSFLSTYTKSKLTLSRVEKDQFIDFDFKIYNKIVEVFYPKIKLGKNTFIKGRVESDEKEFKLKFKSPTIKLFDNYFVENVDIQIKNNHPLFNTYVEIDSFKTDNYKLSKFSLINAKVNDTLFIRSEFKGGEGGEDGYELSLYHTKNEKNNSVVGFKNSYLEFKNKKWRINEKQNKFNKIEFSRDFKNFNILDLSLTHGDASVKLSGTVQDSVAYKDLNLKLINVKLDEITPSVNNLSLKGLVNGNINMMEKSGIYNPTSDITIDKLEINEYFLGDFLANIKGGDFLKKFIVKARLKNGNKNPLVVGGSINVNDKDSNLNLDVTINDLSLRPLNSFLKGVLEDVRGDVFGKVKVYGTFNKPSYNGELRVNNAGLKIPYLNVNYAFEDMASVSVTKDKFKFNNIEITDVDYSSKGKLNGYLRHDYFYDWSLGLNIDAKRLLVLNTKETPDALFFGTGFISGEANLSGLAQSMKVNVVAKTEEGTVFKIPLNDTETFGELSYINFLNRETKVAKRKGKAALDDAIKGLQLDFDLDITENALIEIVLDKQSGSTIKGRGAGGLLAEINTNGKFKMYGDFSVFNGVYNFLYGGLIEKQFTVEPGGTLLWEGDPFNARMNIKALYKTRANPSPLLDSPIRTGIPVDLAINLTGQLEQPEIDFNFDFPNLSSTVKSQIAYRLDSKEDRQNQALYMLSTGSFSQGIGDLSLTGTLTERFNGLINGIISNNDNKLNVGLSYQLGENRPEYQTDDRLGVTLQTQISDRILINGKVGVPIGGLGESVIAGDVQIDFLMNEEGTLTAKVFNRENSINDFSDKEIGYTQGTGVAYNVDFDTFGELIREIFKGSSKNKKSIKSTIEDSLPPEVDNK